MAVAQRDRGRGGRLGALLGRTLESVADPFDVGRARALLAEGRRAEALEALERAREQAAASARDTWPSFLDAGVDDPGLDALDQIAALAGETARGAGWGGWVADAEAFGALASAAARDASEIRAELATRLEARREEERRRRYRKAMALSLALPLVVLVGLFGVEELPAEPSTTAWVLALVVAPVTLGLLAAAATRELWRRGVGNRVLYVPFWVALVAALIALAALLGN